MDTETRRYSGSTAGRADGTGRPLIDNAGGSMRNPSPRRSRGPVAMGKGWIPSFGGMTGMAA